MPFYVHLICFHIYILIYNFPEANRRWEESNNCVRLKAI